MAPCGSAAPSGGPRRRARFLLVLIGFTGVLATAAALSFSAGDASADASGSGVTPTARTGNSNTLRDCQAALGNAYVGLKVEGSQPRPPNGGYTSGPLSVTISNSTGYAFDFTSNIPLEYVVVKGNTSEQNAIGLQYAYGAPGSTGDTTCTSIIRTTTRARSATCSSATGRPSTSRRTPSRTAGRTSRSRRQA